MGTINLTLSSSQSEQRNSLMVMGERERIMAMPYAARLTLPQWREFADEVKRLAHNRCEECMRTSRPLQAHHLYYVTGRLPWEYPHELLMALCGPCHLERQELEQEVFLNVASILRHKRMVELPSLPIHAFFQPIP